MTPNLNQLDRLMAEKVMGWELIHHPTWDDMVCHESWWCHNDKGYYRKKFTLNHPGNYPSIDYYPPRSWIKWHPTTDMNQAMMCVEKLQCGYQFDRLLVAPETYIYKALIRFKVQPEIVDVTSEAANAPLATCQAIAKALDLGEVE